MLMMLCALTSCVFAQTKVDKFLGNLNGAVQIYERYENMLKNAKRKSGSSSVSEYGTVIEQQYGKPLKSLTWSNIQIERQGPYLYVWGLNAGKFVRKGRHTLTVNEQATSYDCCVKQGNRMYRYTVTVVVLAKNGYVYLKDDNNRTIESYTFSYR